MAWVTVEEVKQGVADALKRDAGDLTPAVGRLVAQAVEKAIGQITGALGARGYTTAQIAAWGRLHEFSYDQSLFNAEVYLRQMFVDRAGDLLKAQDRTAELASVVILDADGVPIVPAGANSGILNVRADFDAAVARANRRAGRWCGETYRW